MSKFIISIIIVFSLIFLMGCKSDATAPETDGIVNGGSEDGYPVNDFTTVDLSYPIGSTGEDDIEFGPEFKINVPVRGGDLVVRGTGPSGVPILLVNVSEVGTVLGETIINEDGEFLFTLEQPLVSGHSIGIQLGDITDTELNESDFIYSDTYYERPLIGILFDMVSVE
jgi:hypothetical protein